MGLIYKLTFSNAKIYIGMTTVSLRNRLYCHRFKSTADTPKLLVHRAWKLHGEPLAEVLAIVEKVRALALTPERVALNIAVHLGSKRSDETRAEMSKARKGMRAGIQKSTETRLKISKATRGKYYLSPDRKNT